MREKLTELLTRSYSPYSNFKVASILETKDGQLFEGVNVENASYGATNCAERTAIFTAVTAGYRKNEFKALYLMTKSHNLAMPCHICRQVFTEFFDEDMPVIVMNEQDERQFKIKEIIVHSFVANDLN